MKNSLFNLQNTAAIAVVALLVFFVVSSEIAGFTADRPLQKVNVAYSSISGNVSPLWVTQDKGLFRKYGLDIQAILIESGTDTAQALAAREISFASVAGPAVIQSNLRGSDVVMIAGIINTFTFQLYTERGITRPDQFKGKSLGVTRFGSATDFAMRYAIEKYGLDANKDVRILQLGNQPAQLAALEASRVHGVMLSAPTSLRAKSLGFPMLADLQMLGLEYQHTSIATSRTLIKSQPDLVRDFMRAYIEGIQYAKTHRNETLAIMAKYLGTNDKEVLDNTYESIITTLIPEKPYPTIKGIQIILREFGQKDAAARASSPEQFVDLSIIKGLDNSGFIDNISKPVATAKAAPRTATAVEAAPSKDNSPLQIPDAKSKLLASKEKIQPVAEQISTAFEKAPAPVQKVGQQEYTVKPGDTLSKIAERIYGAIGKWEKIYEANREMLKNPNYLFVGMRLVIPADG